MALKFSHINCAVFGCTNNYRNTASRLVQFYSFPTRPWMKERRGKWTWFARRLDKDGKPWIPTKNHKICSDHFIGGKKSENPNNPSYNPTIFKPELTNSRRNKAKLDRYERLVQRNDHSSTSEKTTSTLTEGPTIICQPERLKQRNKQPRRSSKTTCTITEESQSSVIQMETETDQILQVGTQTDGDSTKYKKLELFSSCINDDGSETMVIQVEIEADQIPQVGTQTGGDSTQYKILELFSSRIKDDGCETMVCHSETKAIEAGCGECLKTEFFGGYASIVNKEAIQDLTAVSHDVFQLLLSLLPKDDTGHRELSHEDQLLLTLMKMKTCLTFRALGTIFGVSQGAAWNSFHYVISCLYCATKDWISFPSKQDVELLPEAFKNEYPNCRLIMDCTEIRTESPPQSEQRVEMYSDHKGCCTAKYLIGITPQCFVSFISHGYGGRASESYIIDDCGILNLLEEGDVVLANKGIPHVQVFNGTALVLPPCLNSRQNEDLMEETYYESSVRIHIEHLLQRLKLFRILSSKVSVKMLPHLDQIVHVCSVILNLSNPLMKD